MTNTELAESSTFSIAKVEINLRNSTEPCSFNYTPCENIKYGAMLRAANEYHEDKEQFKCDAVEKTLCNLLSCMCFTRILNPRNWASDDVNEIIKIGMKIFCEIAEQPDLIWSVLNSVEICSIKMNITKNEDMEGVFMKIESMLSDASKEQIEEEIHFEKLEPTNEVINIPDIIEQRSSLMPQKTTSPILEEILQSLDSKDEIFAILSSSLFNIAIFKINKFYYIFDPKKSNSDGELVRNRLENFIKHSLVRERDLLLERLYKSNETRRVSQEDEFKELLFGRPVVFGVPSMKPSQMLINNNHKNEDDDKPVNVCVRGSAYVSWFTSLDLLCSHIIGKIPEKFRTESFVLSLFDIVTEPEKIVELQKWHNFEPITQNHWIIRGTFSQNDSSQFIHQNAQDSANCIMALLFAELCNDDEWNTTVVDEILHFGDRLYRKSAAKHSENFKLKIKDLELPFFIRPFIINVTDDLIKQDFIFKKDDKFPLESLKMAFKNFMEENRAGILLSKDYFVAVWKNSSDDSLMMFDPHDIGPDGLKKSTGVACLQRFINFSDLIDTFFTNVKDIDGFNEYQLIKITVSMMEHTKDPHDGCPELPFTQKVKVICGKNTQVSSPENISLSICHAIASISLSCSLDSEFYTPDIIDKIVMFGNELMRECKTNDRICFKDFDLNRKSARCDEISWNIQLHETFASVQIDIFQRGVISKKLCPLPNLMFCLEEFFTFHKAGVLITSNFIVAIWKEHCDYLVFYSCKIDDSGRIAHCGHPGIVILKSVHELYSNIISNVHKQDAAFELRICDVKMSESVEEDLNVDCGEKKAMRKMIKEEIIIPAVAHRSDINLAENTINIVEIDGDEELKEMIKNLKKRSGKSFGFIEFSRGGFLCGRLSIKSKTLNKTSRQFHVS